MTESLIVILTLVCVRTPSRAADRLPIATSQVSVQRQGEDAEVRRLAAELAFSHGQAKANALVDSGVRSLPLLERSLPFLHSWAKFYALEAVGLIGWEHREAEARCGHRLDLRVSVSEPGSSR